MKVLVNNGPVRLDHMTGDHFILKWTPPDHHTDSEPRTVSVPMTSDLPTGTLRSIGEQAGMKSFDEFRDWLDRNV
jgi:predicted RNA binding protein YcfA (HicA-like mRNA interferase family)